MQTMNRERPDELPEEEFEEEEELSSTPEPVLDLGEAAPGAL